MFVNNRYITNKQQIIDQEVTAKKSVKRFSRLLVGVSLAGVYLSGWFGPEVKTVQAYDVTSYEERAIRADSRTISASALMPSLLDFKASLPGGAVEQVVGVYVPGTFALPIVQQPAGNPGYVPNEDNVLAQFGMAADYNTVGLLAHNDRAGARFSELRQYQDVFLIFGDGHMQYFQITEIANFQALSPRSPYSDFVNLETGGQMTAGDLFRDVYTEGNRIVFQTCVERDGDPSWGRVFITAVPVEQVEQPLFSFSSDFSSKLDF